MQRKYELGDVVYIKDSWRPELVGKMGIIVKIFPPNKAVSWADYQVKIPTVLNSNYEPLWGVYEIELVEASNKVSKILYGSNEV